MCQNQQAAPKTHQPSAFGQWFGMRTLHHLPAPVQGAGRYPPLLASHAAWRPLRGCKRSSLRPQLSLAYPWQALPRGCRPLPSMPVSGRTGTPVAAGAFSERPHAGQRPTLPGLAPGALTRFPHSQTRIVTFMRAFDRSNSPGAPSHQDAPPTLGCHDQDKRPSHAGQ